MNINIFHVRATPIIATKLTPGTLVGTYSQLGGSL
jgi:hypothetical protein